MGLIAGARTLFARAVATTRTTARVVSTWQQGKPLPSHVDYVGMATDIVRPNIVISACIWEIVTSAAEPEMLAERRTIVNGEEQWVRLPDSHDLPTLLRDPNPEETTDELIERLLTHQQIAGQWNMHKQRSAGGRLAELWALRPDRLRTVPGGDGLVAGYSFAKDNGRPELLPSTDVVTCMLHADPLDDFYGLSPVAVLMQFGDLDNKAAEYLRNFFYNGGAPAGIMKLKATVEAPDRQRLKDIWKQEHGGPHGWHTISVFDADGDYQEIGSRPDSLNMDRIWDATESRICSAFGVPPIIIGCHVGLKRATYANYKEARASFWQETMPIILRRTAKKFTKGVAGEWGADFRVRFALEGVEALQENAESKREFAIAAYDSGLCTLNEARVFAGLPEIVGPEGEARKQNPTANAADGTALSDLFKRVVKLETHGHEGHASGSKLAARRAELRRAAEQYFESMGGDLVDHLRERIGGKARVA
jgi:HK97 family phage portal protein